MNHVREIMKQFRFCGTNKEYSPYGDGHINDTYLITNECDGRIVRYILQRMHRTIVKDPVLLMENIRRVTEYIKNKNDKCDTKMEHCTYELVLTKEGDACFCFPSGEWYRAFTFIEDAASYEIPENEQLLLEFGKIVGHFQKDLKEFVFEDAYYEMTKNFHNTKHRYAQFIEAVNRDSLGRAKEVQELIAFYVSRKPSMEYLIRLAEEQKLPFRATHNDLRLNNALFDKDTGKAIALIDLDTVMPGLVAYDFGDALRSAAKEIDWEDGEIKSVSVNLARIAQFAKGYLQVAASFLWELEVETLADGILLLSLECGMRYLTDYLEGDIYFVKNTHGENKRNAKREMLYAMELEKNMEKIRGIISEEWKKIR